MDHFIRTSLLVLLAYSQLHPLTGASNPKKPAVETQPEYICDRNFTEVQGYINEWIATGDKCQVGKHCHTDKQESAFKLMRVMCSRMKPIDAALREGESQKNLAELNKALEAVSNTFPVCKQAVAKLDEEFDLQLREVWQELEEIQTKVFYSTMSSGRTERALYYKILEGRNNPPLADQFQPNHVEELLEFLWTIPLIYYQRDAYNEVAKIVDSSKDPVLETVYAIDVASVENPNVREQQQSFVDARLERLRGELTSKSFDTLVTIARRFPERYARLSQLLFQLPESVKPSPDVLRSVSHLLERLPSDEQRLQTLEGLVQSLLADNGTVTTDAEYVLPLSQLAHDMTKLGGNLTQLTDKFSTHVSEKSMPYFLRMLSSPTTSTDRS